MWAVFSWVQPIPFPPPFTETVGGGPLVPPGHPPPPPPPLVRGRTPANPRRGQKHGVVPTSLPKGARKKSLKNPLSSKPTQTPKREKEEGKKRKKEENLIKLFFLPPFWSVHPPPPPRPPPQMGWGPPGGGASTGPPPPQAQGPEKTRKRPPPPRPPKTFFFFPPVFKKPGKEWLKNEATPMSPPPPKSFKSALPPGGGGLFPPPKSGNPVHKPGVGGWNLVFFFFPTETFCVFRARYFFFFFFFCLFIRAKEKQQTPVWGTQGFCRATVGPGPKMSPPCRHTTKKANKSVPPFGSLCSAPRRPPNATYSSARLARAAPDPTRTALLGPWGPGPHVKRKPGGGDPQRPPAAPLVAPQGGPPPGKKSPNFGPWAWKIIGL